MVKNDWFLRVKRARRSPSTLAVMSAKQSENNDFVRRSEIITTTTSTNHSLNMQF